MTDAGRALVVGATGRLGMETVRLLRTSGHAVRAAVRPDADATKLAQLEKLGAELVPADLAESASLVPLCRGVIGVVSTATAVVPRRSGDSIGAVDERGQMALVEAAEAAGVERFTLVSFPPVKDDFLLQRAKRAVETRLREGRMRYTILQPAHFMESWLAPEMGFDPARGVVRVFGNADQPVSWISFRDVARIIVAAFEDARLERTMVPLGGPDALSQRDVAKICEELGVPVTMDTLDVDDLERLLKHAANPSEEAFAAIALTIARGFVIDNRGALEVVPGRLSTVREYLREKLRVRNK